MMLRGKLGNQIFQVRNGKQIVMQLADLTILAQEARNYNDVAYRKFKETNAVDDTLVASAVDCLVKMRPWATGVAMEQYSVDPDLVGFCKKICAGMLANTFRQLNLEMYQKDEFHVLFMGLFRDFSKSDTIIKEFGEDLVDCAKRLMSQLDDNSPYKKLYQNISQGI